MFRKKMLYNKICRIFPSFFIFFCLLFISPQQTLRANINFAFNNDMQLKLLQNKSDPISHYELQILNFTDDDFNQIIVSEINSENPDLPHASEPLQIGSKDGIGRILSDKITDFQFGDGKYMDVRNETFKTYHFVLNNTKKYVAIFISIIIKAPNKADKYYATLVIQEDSDR